MASEFLTSSVNMILGRPPAPAPPNIQCCKACGCPKKIWTWLLRIAKKVEKPEFAHSDPDHTSAANRGLLYRIGQCFVAACNQKHQNFLPARLYEDTRHLMIFLLP